MSEYCMKSLIAQQTLATPTSKIVQNRGREKSISRVK
jgi:hypothetical protein